MNRYIFRNPEIYGSAICKYTYTSLEAAFNGPFKAENKDKIWAPVPDSDVPARRPGSVCVKWFPSEINLITVMKLQKINGPMKDTFLSKNDCGSSRCKWCWS